MKVVYIEGVRDKIFQTISKANKQNKPIDCIILTREENDELQTFSPGDKRINSFDGVRIVVEKSAIIMPKH